MKAEYKHLLPWIVSLSLLGSAGHAQTTVMRPADRTNRPPRPHPRDLGAPPPMARGQFGDPLPGLTTDEAAAFATGKLQFQEVDTVANGLGPVYNNVSCVACHAGPAIGGSSPIVETRFGKMSDGQFDPLLSEGGSLLQQAAIDPACQESVPADANVVATRKTTPLFGLGLIEAIPDATILANVHARPIDGITGRAAIITDIATGARRVGRFGWKNQQATVLSFAGDAYVNEIGITNRLFPAENAPDGNAALLAQFDTVSDPEDQPDPATGKADIDRLADFMRLLGAPPAVPLSPVAQRGGRIFHEINCTACHLPSLNTGPNASEALNMKEVPLFSDLLLHDMGLLGDGIAQGDASPTEMRTAPLWGLRARPPYLHDGRASTVDGAIRMHDGEALQVRERYTRLSPADREALLAFLNSL